MHIEAPNISTGLLESIFSRQALYIFYDQIEQQLIEVTTTQLICKTFNQPCISVTIIQTTTFALNRCLNQTVPIITDSFLPPKTTFSNFLSCLLNSSSRFSSGFRRGVSLNSGAFVNYGKP
jgi:hypothetical protein